MKKLILTALLPLAIGTANASDFNKIKRQIYQNVSHLCATEGMILDEFYGMLELPSQEIVRRVKLLSIESEDTAEKFNFIRDNLDKNQTGPGQRGEVVGKYVIKCLLENEVNIFGE